ncbi:MAG TPA: SDR family NAD(P)-dependent oxidoreductase [Cyclobacteriaceae bacterium]|nr:SDR family NAD(P)-dependent oxidoreductase [Cyclobacteriaceae bacterium]
MDRNIIVTGGAGNLGRGVIGKFKREGYKVIATVRPDSGAEIEEADDIYEVDLTQEKSVEAFAKEYAYQYGEIEAIALLVGGYSPGTIEDTPLEKLSEMISLNFYSAYNMVRHFLPPMKKANKGRFLLVGARPALQPEQGKTAAAYSLSKGLILQLSDLINQEVAGTAIRSHVFVPSIIDTPENREAMENKDFSKWVSSGEIAEAMHYAVSSPSLKNMVFKLYGGV